MKRRILLIAIVSVWLTHVLVLLLVPKPLFLSNVVQVFASGLATLVCLHKAHTVSSRYFKLLWTQLVSAFFIWTAAQVWYTSSIMMGVEPRFPSGSDFLWMLFAFPLFLVTSNTQETRHDWVAWLDIGQACISVAVLSVLIFSLPALVTTGTAYDIQAIALLLACSLRYSVSTPGPERVFFGNLALCSLVYCVTSILGYLGPDHGFRPGGVIDLCWSAPFLVFCLLVERSDMEKAAPRGPSAGSMRRRLHGIGAFFLALMSIGVSGFLSMHRPAIGILALTLAFLFFAARMNMRELQLHAAHDRLELASLHDSLTGLANRTLLLRELSRCFAERNLRDFAVLFIDLDRFKLINDSLGHAYGDRLLQKTAKIVQSTLRPGNILARLGGDEFCVLIEDLDGPQAADTAASNILAKLHGPLTLEGRVTYLSASIGTVMGTAAASGDEILRNADCAMYEAKALGKDRAVAFVPMMLQKANEELLLETDLRQSLADEAILVWYQPIYSIANDTIYGFEALARWRHPVRGLVSPAEFIPIAEDTGLIIELGKQVLKQACLQVRLWNAQFRSNLAISVNISACQFADPNLVRDIEDILRSTHLDPKLLKLEVTESVLIDGVHSVQDVLNSARALGIEIYLDDFGTGYSSLSYLLDFPFDVVKIDRSFIRNLEQDDRRAEVVRSIVQLTTNLGKRAIAEGVETYGELNRLHLIGCDLIQGFLLSKPLPPDILEGLLAESTTDFLQTFSRLQNTKLIAGSAIKEAGSQSPPSQDQHSPLLPHAVAKV